MEDKSNEIVFYIKYFCNGSQRTTLVFMDSKLLESLTYEDVVTFIRSNVHYLSHIGKFRMTIINGDDVDIIPAKFVWQIRDAMKRLNKLELNVFESSTPSPLQTPKRL